MKIILALLTIACGSAMAQINLSNQEPTVIFITTNAFGLPDTNYFRVVPIQNPVLANGSIITRGIAIRMYPDTNGIAYTNFAQGWFQMTNQFLGQGIIFEVPNNTNSYRVGSLARSGFNTYEMTGVLGLTSGDGSVTLNPSNGVGFVDLSDSGLVSTNWPPGAPLTYGQIFFWNSNGVEYRVNSKQNALTWTKTNLISSP